MVKSHSKDRQAPGFKWLGAPFIPAEFDLRRCGWRLENSGELSGELIGLIRAADLGELGAFKTVSGLCPETRRFVMIVGVATARERALLLERGFGEAMPSAIDLAELEARAMRLAKLDEWLPRLRSLGDLRLDLLAREAYGRGKPLNLNPREFALLWRLADTPGQTVSKQDLIADVWRMGFVPETNSIAVHMSRLRRKLSFVGYERMIETIPEGGYRLKSEAEVARHAVAAGGANGIAVPMASAL